MRNLIQKAEALIFMALDKGIKAKDLKKWLACSQDDLDRVIQVLSNKYNATTSGIQLVFYGQAYRFVTNPVLDQLIMDFLNVHKEKQLSQSALETLAIVAYKQPITRLEIEEIRGISCEVIIRKLVAMDLLEEAGRLESPGRPILYQVTDAFYDVFKMTSLDELPPLVQAENEEKEIL